MKNTLLAPWFALIAIALAAFVIYSNIYHSPFVFDDINSITDKVRIRDLSNFSSPGRFLQPRSIVNLTFALNYRFGKLSVFGYHLVNVLIHIINGFLVYFLSLTIFKQLLSGSTQRFDGFSKRKAFSSKDNQKHGTSNMLLSEVSAASNTSQSSIINHQSSINLMSLFAALIFVVHPIQTQAVTYTVQRYASLAAMFYMGSVFFYLKARVMQQRSEVNLRPIGAHAPVGGEGGEERGAFSFMLSAYFVLSILCGLLAFVSKQNTASLPGAIILVEYLFIDRTWQGWKKKILWFTPIFILFTIFILYVSGFFSGAHAGRGLLEDVSNLMKETGSISRWSYLCTQFNVLVIYIRLLFLPIGQNLDYFYPFKSGFFDAYTPLAFMFLAGLAALGIWNRKKRPIITFGIFWFFITLSVESGIIPISDALFEHRLYLPMLGFALIVSYLLFYLLSKKRLWAAIISLSIIVSLGTATYMRNMTWQDGVKLWSDVISKNPENPRGYNCLGIVLDEQGMQEKAIQSYSKSLEIRPDYAKVHNNLGLVLYMQEKYEDAIHHYSEALKISPKYAKAHSNLGLVLVNMGRLDDAIRHFSEALRHRPDDEKIHNSLGIALMRQGNFKEATKHFLEALRVKPDYAIAHNSLGIILIQQGRLDDAIRHFSEALRVRPEDAKIHNNLGLSLMRKGNLKEAERHFSEALRIKPDYGKARRNLESVRRYMWRTR